jgi:Cu2+-exporting ATPase
MAAVALNQALAWDDPDEQAQFTRPVPGCDGAALSESSLRIEGITCAACALQIEERLQGQPGVAAAAVNAASGRLLLRWNPQRTRISRLAALLQADGFALYPVHGAAAEAERARAGRQTLWRLFVAAFCMMQVMMFATPAYLAAPGEITPDQLQLLNWAGWLLSIPVLVFSAQPFLAGAWRDLRRRRLGMDVPVALGIVVTFIASSGAAFAPGGPFGHEVYFDSLTMFVFLLLGARWLEQRARDTAARAIEGLVQRLPATVERLLDDGRSDSVAPHRLRPGDRVRVLAGQAFPADGRLLEGTVAVDEALLTGESTPQRRGPGDAVIAGSHNRSGVAVMVVDKAASDTRYAQIVALMEQAAMQRPATAQAAERIARPFVAAVLATALIAAVAWQFIDPARSVWVAVAVLIVTCPCALSLATPSALLAATGALARRGLLVRRPEALESLAGCDVAVFDKTGTLTEDTLQLVRVDRLDRSAEGPDIDLLAHAAALAGGSLHPISRAIAAAAAEATGAATGTTAAPTTGSACTTAATTTAATAVPLRDIREHAGQGLEARDASGRLWRLGRQAFAMPTTYSPLLPPISGVSTAWLSVDGRPLARFAFAEQLRPDARRAVAELQALGLRVALLSGDRDEAARRVATALGISELESGATPEHKQHWVQRMQAAGHRVVMVGDGLNDGPVAAQADVSIAIGQGAPLVHAQADFTLPGARLAEVAEARRLAAATLRVIRQNLAWAAGYNAISVPLAVMGWLPPWAAGIGMAASSLLVMGNAARLRGRAMTTNP